MEFSTFSIIIAILVYVIIWKFLTNKKKTVNEDQSSNATNPLRATIEKFGNRFSSKNKFSKTIIIVAICACYLLIVAFAFRIPMAIKANSVKATKEAAIQETISAINNNLNAIQIDLSGYTMVTEPIGIDNAHFTVSKDFSDNINVCFAVNAYKNTGFPINSVVLIDLEVFNKDGNSIGIVRSDNSKNLNAGDSCEIGFNNIFTYNANNALTYNNIEIGKLTIVEVNETDNQIQTLKNELSSKEKYLREYIEKGDEVGFNTYYEQVIALYPAETFAAENAALNEIKREADEKFAADKEASETQLQDTTEQNQNSTEQNQPNSVSNPDVETAESVAEREYLTEERIRREQLEQEERMGYDTGITFQQLSRNPGEYKNKKVTFTGKVFQVLEGNGVVNLMMDLRESDYGIWEDRILVYYNPSIVPYRVLEGDIITIYGVSMGLHTYESIMGQYITVPLINVHKIEQ